MESIWCKSYKAAVEPIVNGWTVAKELHMFSVQSYSLSFLFYIKYLLGIIMSVVYTYSVYFCIFIFNLKY